MSTSFDTGDPTRIPGPTEDAATLQESGRGVPTADNFSAPDRTPPSRDEGFRPGARGVRMFDDPEGLGFPVLLKARPMERMDSHSSPIRVAFLTREDPRDRRAYSGVHFHMMRALESHGAQVLAIGPLASPRLGTVRFFDHLLGKATGRHIDWLHSRWVARGFARRIERWLDTIDCDALFAPVGSSMIAYLETDRPVVYVADATFALLEDSYPVFTRLLSSSSRQAHEIEQRAIDRSTRVVYASEWAADSARRDYQCDPAKIRIEPFGCNLERVPSRSIAEARDVRAPIRLLFIAAEWERKGGDTALDTLAALEASGVDAELRVIGVDPPKGIPRVTALGFLDKNDPTQAERYAAELESATVLLAPTKQDCSPMVYAEAAAFGLPCVTSDVGGVASLVLDGPTGRVLPANSDGSRYAECIREIVSDPARYRAMALAARDRYESDLNWDRWGRAMASILREVCPATKPAGDAAVSQETNGSTHRTP